MSRRERDQTMLSITLPAEIEERVKAAAKTMGCSEAFLVREAIIEYLGEFEDLQIAEQRLRDHRAGRSRTYTLEEVARELGLADKDLQEA